MEFGILGAGNVGLAVGRQLTHAGHHVLLPVRAVRMPLHH
jgi:predicted dinucleotide-binding enzyme